MTARNVLVALSLVVLTLLAWNLRWVLLVLFGRFGWVVQVWLVSAGLVCLVWVVSLGGCGVVCFGALV